MKEDQRLNILFLPRWYPGRTDPQLGVFIRKHAEAAALRHGVSVICPIPDPALRGGLQEDYFVRSEVMTYVVYYPQHDGVLSRLRNGLAYFRAWRRALRAARFDTPSFHLVHVHVLLKPLILGWVLSRALRIPLIVTEHWTGYVLGFFRTKPWWYRKTAGFLLRYASFVTTVSSSLRDAMVNSGLRHPAYRVLPNVVEVSASEPVSLGTDRKVILTVADLVERNKNVAGVLKVVAEIYALRDDFEHHIVGDGPDAAMLKDMARTLGLLDEVVFFHGRKSNEEVAGYLRACDFLVVNSHVETFSVVAAEAMACGKPVIATRCGGPEDFIGPEHGILIDPGDLNALKDSIIYVLDHTKDFDPVVMKSFVTAHFSMEAVGRRLSELYSEAIRS